MKYYIITAIAVITTALSAWAASTSPDMFRIMATRPKETAAPATGVKTNVYGRISSAQGMAFRLLETDSVLELGGVNTTAADGERRLNVRNTVSRTYTPVEGDLDTDADGKLWIYTSGQWVENGAAAPAPIPMSGLSDWPAGVDATEVGYLNGVTSGIQAQIDGIVAGSSDRVAAPQYSDSTCSTNQWADDGQYHYRCTATNTWDRYAVTYVGWNNPTPTATTDNFDRADGALGANWTTPTGTAALAIFSNKVGTGTFGQAGYGIFTGTTFTDNQYAQAVLGSSAIDYGSVACRMDSSGNGYLASCVTNTNCRIYKRTSDGTLTNLGAVPAAVDSAYGKTLKITCSGTTISATLDGVEYANRTDSSFTSGSPGLVNKSQAAGGNMDNFEAGNL